MDASAVIMLEAHSRSGPTEMGWTNAERIRSSLTIRKTGNGQSGQYFRKKKMNGRQASKNESQLETTTATELANAFSSGIRNSCGSLIAHARNFFSRRPWACGRRAFQISFGHPKKNGGVLASTRSLKRRRHVEDGSLASLKSGPKQINADHQDLALAA